MRLTVKRIKSVFQMLQALILLLSAGVALAAVDTVVTEQVQVKLLASLNVVRPGDEFYLGVHQRIIPNWHTYWKNPGDSGIATTIDWDLPAGATAGDILWPVPDRHRMGPIINYGYDNQVTLPSKIKVPDDAKIGSVFSVHATLDWLVCREECIPQQAKLTLNLPVAETAKISADGKRMIDEVLAQQPVDIAWPVNATADKDGLTLRIAAKALQLEQVKDIWFYPDTWGKIAQSTEQIRVNEHDAVAIRFQHGDEPLKSGEVLSGILAVTEVLGGGTITRGFNIKVTPFPVDGTTGNDSAKLDFAAALVLALLGGVILNLMPCVFPVLSIKTIALVSHAGQSPLQIRLQGVAYTIGVLTSFALLAITLIILKAGGLQIGWGFQFQSPLFVLSVAYLLFLVGLSLSGVFVIGNSIAGIGSSLADKSGYTGSFFTGVLATIVATPCSAPFMAVALGYALIQPPFKLLLIFLSLGLGLALPYLILTSWPPLQKRLPRPGIWMERVKQVLAFPMYGTAVWLVWVLAQQAGANAVAIALGGMVLIAFAVWLYGITRNASLAERRTGSLAAVVLLFSVLTGSYAGIESGVVAVNDRVVVSNSEKHWEKYTPERLKQLLAEGRPVFLNITAAWCISCLVNEHVALSNGDVINAFRESGITYLKGDWTNRDAHVTEVLTRFGRSGVPLYVFYPAGKVAKPTELPQILTSGIVLSAIKQSPFTFSNQL